MKIRIEYEVPEGDCLLCENGKLFVGCGGVCTLFDEALEDDGKFKYQRCQPCIDATVKEGE